MTNQSSNTFMRRQQKDGSQDSICLACMATISSPLPDSDPEREEQDHVCSLSFRSIRSKRPIDSRPANVRFPPFVGSLTARAADQPKPQSALRCTSRVPRLEGRDEFQQPA